MRIKVIVIISIIIALYGWGAIGVYGAGTAFNLAYANHSDNFKWNIAGDLSGQNPNILSELTWSGLKVNQVSLELERTFGDNLFLKGVFAPGWVDYGLVHDTDYLENNRGSAFSRSVSVDNGDALLDTSLVFGFKILQSGNLEISPLLGYAYYGQKLRMTDGYQLIPDTGPIPGLNSTYQAGWSGPLLGMDMQIPLGKRNVLTNSIEYHWGDYYGEGDWNLRDDLNHPCSFTHTASGTGIFITTGVDLSVNKNLALYIAASYNNRHTGQGIDRTFNIDGTEDITLLNEADLQSFVMMVGVSMRV